MDKISVVITCYKEGELLLRAINSVENHTDNNFEILIVNDASMDDVTNKICHELERENKARIIWRKKNGGLSAVRNSSYEAMQGDICVSLAADDILPQGTIGAIRKGFIKTPEADFVFGNYILRKIKEGTEELIDTSVFLFFRRILGSQKINL